VFGLSFVQSRLIRSGLENTTEDVRNALILRSSGDRHHAQVLIKDATASESRRRRSAVAAKLLLIKAAGMSLQGRLRTFVAEPSADSEQLPGVDCLLGRSMPYHVTKRTIVADPNLTLVWAKAPRATDLGGNAPNYLCVMAANLPLSTGIRPVVIEHTLCRPTGYDVVLADLLALAPSIAPG